MQMKPIASIPSTYSIDENGKIISGTAYEVKSIGAYCFANNNLIESVHIPDTVITIENRAFYNCAKIATANITRNIASIGEDVFELCPQLKTVTKNGKSGLIIDDNDNLSSFIIPDSITKIDDDSFTNWVNLTSVSIGENIDYIGNNAFSHCKNLSRVSINSSLNYFGKKVFNDCEKLTDLSSLTPSDKDNVFVLAPQPSLRSFDIPLSITTIRYGFSTGGNN